MGMINIAFSPDRVSTPRVTLSICLFGAIFLVAACSSTTNSPSEAGIDLSTLDSAPATDTEHMDTTDTNSAIDTVPLTDTVSDSTSPSNTGNLQWVKGVSNETGVVATDVVALSGGAVVVTGTISGKATFALGEPGETSVDVGEYETGFFIAKYDHNGQLAWVHAGNTKTSTVPAVAAAADGSLLITAMCSDGTIIGSITLPSCAAFIARYLGDGTLTWAKPITGQQSQALRPDIAADPQGGFYVSGWAAESSLTFEPNGPGLTVVAAKDSFIARFDQSGALDWLRTLGKSSGQRFLALAAHSDGAATVAGTFTDTMTLGSGDPTETTVTSTDHADLFVARYSRLGVLSFAHKADLEDINISGLTVEGRVYSFAMSGTPDDGVAIAGAFIGILTFDPNGPKTFRMDSAGYTDPFAVRLAVDGTPIWAKTYPSSAGVVEVIGGISVHADGTTRLAGYVKSNASDAAYLHSYDDSGTRLWDRRTSGDSTHSNGVAVDKSGATTMVGDWDGTVLFGVGEPNETQLSSKIVQPSLFIARFQ